MAEEQPVFISEADSEGFRQSIRAGGHEITSDEPESFGGTDQGLSPYQLLAAGLGSCTSMTIRMGARKRKIPLRHVEVEIVHDRIHAKDCADCESTSGMVDRFLRRITLTGDLDAEQRAYLIGVADRCPVHRTLSREIRIVTEDAS